MTHQRPLTTVARLPAERYRWGRLLKRLRRALARPYHLARFRRMRTHVPVDEFDPSLETDVALLEHLTTAEREDYFSNLAWRRQQAHERALAGM